MAVSDISICDFLLFANLAAAQARSRQLAGAMHVDGTNTVYWHMAVQLTDGSACMVIESDPKSPYSAKPGPTALSQLTPSEIAALVPWSSVQAIWPTS
jgi:hypothetical protein